MNTFTDATGRKLGFEVPPKRVVSLIPSITESLFDLGIEDSLVGISNYCIYPKAGVATKAKVGGQKNPDFKKIQDLQPDLIILNKEENKPEHIKELSQHYKTYTCYPRKYIDTAQLLQELGLIFHIEEKTNKLAALLKEQYQELRQQKKQNQRVLYLIWRGPWMSLNQDTFIHDILQLHHFENCCAEKKDRYFELSGDDIEALDPEIIFLPDEPYPFKEKHLKDFETLNVKAVQQKKIFLVDGTYFCWYGTRTLKTSEYIKDQILKHF